MCCHCIHIFLRLHHGDARPESSNDHQWVGTIVQLLLCEDQRHSHLKDVAVRDARLEDTYYRVRFSAHAHCAADQLGISSELAPEPVREDNNTVFPFVVLVQQEITPEEEGAAERAVVICGNSHTPDVLWLVFFGNVERGSRTSAEGLGRPAPPF